MTTLKQENELKTTAATLAPPMNSEQQLREMNDALLVSSVHQHELTEQAQTAEVAMRESERRFREMIDALPTAIYTTDAQGRLTHFNPACVELSGRVPELGSDHWCITWKLFHPDGTPMPHEECPMAIALKEGRIVHGTEAIAERPDGTRIWFTPYPTPLRDARGRIVGGINMLVDITEHKQAEEVVRESEVRYRNLFNSMDEGYCIIEVIFDADDKPVDYRFVEVNHSFEKQSGMHDVVGKRMLQFVPSNEEPWLANYGKVARTGEPIRFAAELKGLNRWFDVYAFRVGGSGSHRVAVLFTDITERKRGERASAHLAAIVTSSEDAIVSKDLNGIITSWNKGAEHLFGYCSNEIIGKSVTMLIPADHIDEEPQILARVRKGEVIDHYETVRQRKDGRLVDISLTISPLKDAAGQIMGASKIARDISDRSRLERETKEQAESLADLHRRKDEFLAMLSHELRNPLAPISNAVQLLGLQKNQDQLQKQARAIIERQVGQLVRLVDDLLEVSRLTTGRIHLQQEQVTLNGIVDNAVETVRPLIGQRGHAIHVHLPPEPIWLHADAARLEQLVVNLLTNAAKYTDECGHIWLSAQQEGAEAVLRVRDSGVGIAPELLPRIFDLFTQAERSLDRAQGGLGIGLSLVQRLAEMHGGRVEVQSSLGQGSEFVVRLPVMPTAAPSPSQPTEQAPLTEHPLRVLTVDDNIDGAHILGMLLTASGHQVRTAHNGPDALEAALDFRPDLVLMDIGLPGMSGLEVAKRLREQPDFANVVLVAVTGYGQESDRQLSKEAGFDHHLVKPADYEKLQQILATIKAK